MVCRDFAILVIFAIGFFTVLPILVISIAQIFVVIPPLDVARLLVSVGRGGGQAALSLITNTCPTPTPAIRSIIANIVLYV